MTTTENGEEAIERIESHQNEITLIFLDLLMPKKNGLEWHEMNVFAGFDEDGEAIINILGRDVTEAHDKADTKAQLEIANASSTAKSAFLFNMSHDIRTPMNAIIGFTELLDKHLDDKKLAKSYISKIQTSNEFLLSLINNVLEMARIESGKATLDETYWNADVFNDMLYSQFDSQMKQKGITFTGSIQVEHNEVICDATKLREIFLNILSNSLKYTPAGGTVTMELRELPADRPGYVLYQTKITDTGIGMAEDNELNAEIAITILEEKGFEVEHAEDVHAAKTVGMNEHIAKPLNLNTLAKTLNRWL